MLAAPGAREQDRLFISVIAVRVLPLDTDWEEGGSGPVVSGIGMGVGASRWRLEVDMSRLPGSMDALNISMPYT